MIVHCLLKQSKSKVEYVIAYVEKWSGVSIGEKQVSTLSYPSTALNIIETILATPDLNVTHIIFIIDGNAHILDKDLEYVVRLKKVDLKSICIGLINRYDYIIDNLTYMLYMELVRIIYPNESVNTIKKDLISNDRQEYRGEQ